MTQAAKIQNLLDHATTPGERAAARAALKRVKKETLKLKYENEMECRLIVQLYQKVTKQGKGAQYFDDEKRGIVLLKGLSDREVNRIAYLYLMSRRPLADAMNNAFFNFVQLNSLGA